MSFRNGDIRNGKVAGSSVTWREEFVCQITRRSSHGFAWITRIKRTGKRIRADRCDPWLLWALFVQLGVHGDLGVQDLGNRAAALGVLRSFLEGGIVPVGNTTDHVQMHCSYGPPGIEL